jgi:hypothetical protein
MAHTQNYGMASENARDGVDTRNKDLTTLSQGNMGVTNAAKSVGEMCGIVFDTDLSKPDAWYRESETLPKEMNEDDFFVGLSEPEWELLSHRRRHDYSDARDWTSWCEHIEWLRRCPVTPPTLRSTVKSVDNTPRLIALRRDYMSDPAKYFSTIREQRHAIAKLESEILHSAMQRRLTAELVIERQAARHDVAVEKIQKAWAQMKVVREAQDEMEKAWSEFDRICEQWD